MEDKDRIDKLELITTRLSRRAHKRAVAMLTPYPISNAVIGDKVEGNILHYMFPCDGKVIKAVVDVGKKPKQSINVTISLMGEESGESRTIVLTKRRDAIEPNIEVKTFDRLSVSISYESEKLEDALNEVWISFLWIPTTKDVEIKSFLIEELESDLSKG